jgi:hypothetical protein
MVIVCCLSHAVLGAVASRGPTPDIDQLDGVLAEVLRGVRLAHVVLDAGFDSGADHRLLREDLGIRSTIPPEHGRPPKDPRTLPTDPYRRLMKRRFNRRAYRKRVQVETVFSMLKRNLGSALRGRSHHARRRDMLLRVLTHNLMLVFIEVFYRARMSPFSSPPFSSPPFSSPGRAADAVAHLQVLRRVGGVAVKGELSRRSAFRRLRRGGADGDHRLARAGEVGGCDCDGAP